MCHVQSSHIRQLNKIHKHSNRALTFTIICGSTKLFNRAVTLSVMFYDLYLQLPNCFDIRLTLLFRKPVVCGVTNLEYDHVEVLGETLGEIAWHKAGIFKVSSTAHHPHIIMIYNHFSLEYLHIQSHRRTKHCKS